MKPLLVHTVLQICRICMNYDFIVEVNVALVTEFVVLLVAEHITLVEFW